MADDVNKTTPAVDYAHPPEHPEQHEHSDVNIRALWIVLGITAVSAVAIHFLLWGTFKWFDNSLRAADPPPSGVIATPRTPPPGTPRLQGIPGYSSEMPRQDLADMRKEFHAQLYSYGRNADGSLHIPIERAMQLIVEKKPPQARRAATQPMATQPTTQEGGDSVSD
jgi:hypothetical protein